MESQVKEMNDMERQGMAWHSKERKGKEIHDIAWHGKARHSMERKYME
jgi:hypothetical protein